jgi:hypothetical protein
MLFSTCILESKNRHTATEINCWKLAEWYRKATLLPSMNEKWKWDARLNWKLLQGRQIIFKLDCYYPSSHQPFLHSVLTLCCIQYSRVSETACSSETSVNYYQIILYHIPEDCILQSDVDGFLWVFSRSNYLQHLYLQVLRYLLNAVHLTWL